VPATTALTAVRRRIGERPLESLFRRLCPALSPGRSPWSHVCGLLAVAWDGTTMAAEASAANTAAFGKPGTPKRRPAPGAAGKDDGQAEDPAAACPQLRLVTLVACGTRALLDAAAGPLRGKGTGEQHLARQLLGSVRAGMLLIADRGFCSYQLWRAAAATGAHLLWRAKNDMHLPVLAELPDGSWLTRITDPRAARAQRHKNGTRRRRGSTLPPDTSPLPGITVRVIAFTLTVTADDGKHRTEPCRLLTTLLDHQACPAAELARAYAWRWAIETGYRECKTYLRGPGRRLRGRTPDLARQELWAYLVIYQAIRVIIIHAAAGAGIDPDRISFTAALHAARRTIPAARARMNTTLASAQAEILTTLVPQREGRIYPRAVSKPISPYPSRSTRPGPISQHAQYTLTTTTPANRTSTSTHQDKQTGSQHNNPP
jgi:hypothetical protein